ncbi:MAG: CU044_2847 family protein [Desulfomonilaceae bacterium]
MSTLVRIPTDEGDSIVMEVEELESSGPLIKAAAGEDKLVEATVTVKEALDKFRGPLKGVVEKLRELTEPLPQQVEVEFGFTFSAEVGFVVAKGSASGNFKVKLTWKQDQK